MRRINLIYMSLNLALVALQKSAKSKAVVNTVELNIVIVVGSCINVNNLQSWAVEACRSNRMTAAADIIKANDRRITTSFVNYLHTA